MALKDLIVRNKRNELADHSDFFNPFDDFHRNVDRLFDNFFGDFKDNFLELRRESSFSPKIDVSEDESGINIAAELPGIDEKDVKVSYQDGSLLIKGEKVHEDKKEDKNYYHMERSYGSFQRSIRVPEEVDVDKISASFKNGLLKIKLPKLPEAKSKVKQIEVKSA